MGLNLIERHWLKSRTTKKVLKNSRPQANRVCKSRDPIKRGREINIPLEALLLRLNKRHNFFKLGQTKKLTDIQISMGTANRLNLFSDTA